VVNIFGNLFKRKKPKLSKKDQEEFLKRKEISERFTIEYEKGFYAVYLDGEVMERFKDSEQAREFIDSVVATTVVGEMDY